MAASKNRMRWSELPAPVQARIATLAGGPVVAAENCAGGFSPGLAARLRLATGRRAFVKALDCAEWPSQGPIYQAEARVAAALPTAIAAPRLLGSHDDGRWVLLAFECVPGTEPARPWRLADLDRVVMAAGQLAAAATRCQVEVPRDHPRLGGWAALAADEARRAALVRCSPWAAARLPALADLEAAGLLAARGSSLVHFDMYAHNVLLTADGVFFVDWPHSRRGAPFVDLVILLASAAADGIDPEPFLAASPLTAAVAPEEIDGLLAAHSGFCLFGALESPEPGLEPIYAVKLELGLAALGWLQRRPAR